jgi:hypothetical protein
VKPRGLTWMLAAVATFAAAARADEGPAQKSLFTPCAEALPTPEFAPLRAVIPGAFAESAGCLRLTNREFLLFAQPFGPGQPFHYCDLRTSAPGCKAEPHWFYAFETKQQFTGANGKRYMLWHTWQMKRGIYSDGYGIFSLVPRSIDPRGFAVYTLPGGMIFQGEDPANSDPCRDLGDEATEITGYELRGEGTEEVELRFTQRRIDCKTRQETLGLLRYQPKNGKFERLP